MREQSWESMTSQGWEAMAGVMAAQKPLESGESHWSQDQSTLGAEGCRKASPEEPCWGQPGFLHMGLTQEDPCSGFSDDG